MQACGLKQKKCVTWVHHATVTPHAGVWIETDVGKGAWFTTPVTPHAGVWIETVNVKYFYKHLVRSRLMQACGLKRHISSKINITQYVTPHAGVWIETEGQNC